MPVNAAIEEERDQAAFNGAGTLADEQQIMVWSWRYMNGMPEIDLEGLAARANLTKEQVERKLRRVCVKMGWLAREELARPAEKKSADDASAKEEQLPAAAASNGTSTEQPEAEEEANAAASPVDLPGIEVTPPEEDVVAKAEADKPYDGDDEDERESVASEMSDLIKFD